MEKDQPVDLGGDILFYAGSNPEILASLGDRGRFLDVLWLPTSLDCLNSLQINVISRFREKRLAEDPQFQQAAKVRSALAQVLVSRNVRSILEIGCGKFPICNDVSVAFYRGIEIDRASIHHCRCAGLDVIQIAHLRNDDQLRFDVALSLYTFHFYIDDRLIDYVDTHLRHSGVLIFNLIAEDAISCLTKLSRLSRRFPLVQIIKRAGLSKREFVVVMGRTGRRALVDISGEIEARLIECER
jgi:hypothetical protein